MQNCCLVCFNSGVLTNQVTYILTEVVPFCKSSHICPPFINNIITIIMTLIH